MLVGGLVVLAGGGLPGVASFLNPATSTGPAPSGLALREADAASIATSGAPSSAAGSRVDLQYYVDPNTPAARQVAELLAQGRTDDANQLRKIADQPVAHWVGGSAGEMAAQVRDYVGRATAANRQPLIVAYAIPNRDCGSYSAGGTADQRNTGRGSPRWSPRWRTGP